MSVKEINEKHLATLHPEVARRVRKLLEAAARDGYTLQIVQSLRTVEEQNKLFAKGRTAPGKKVTNAKGGKSWHNYGLAADVAPVINGKVSWDEKAFDWSRIGSWARSAALEWGGSWKKLVDRPHVQWTGDLTIARALELYYAGGLKKVWSAVHSSESFAALKASEIVTERDEDLFDDTADVHEKEIQNSPAVPQQSQTTSVKESEASANLPTDTAAGEQTANAIVNMDDGVKAQVQAAQGAPVEVAKTEPTNFLSKAWKAIAALFTGGVVIPPFLQNFAPSAITKEMVELIKFFFPYVFFGGLAVLIVWFVVKKMNNFHLTKLFVETNTDPTKKDVMLVNKK